MLILWQRKYRLMKNWWLCKWEVLSYNTLKKIHNYSNLKLILFLRIYRFGTQQAKKGSKALVLHFTEEQIVVFLCMMWMFPSHLRLSIIGTKSFSSRSVSKSFFHIICLQGLIGFTWQWRMFSFITKWKLLLKVK